MGVPAEMIETGDGSLNAFFNGEAIKKAKCCTRCGLVECTCEKQAEALSQIESETTSESITESTTKTTGEVRGTPQLFGTTPYQRTLNLVEGFPEKALRRMGRAIDAASPEQLATVLGQAREVYDLLRYHGHDDIASILEQVAMDKGAPQFDLPEPEPAPDLQPADPIPQYAYVPIPTFGRKG